MSNTHDHDKVARSEPNMYGGYNYYDNKGHKIGYSTENMTGGLNHYDEKGHKTGYSDPSFFGTGYNHYDAKGHKIGYSNRNMSGGFNKYDNNGHKTGESNPNFTGGYNNSEGCYIATCVYGSYDTPQVWTLRRFRDQYLGSMAAGRMFIHTYYAISPKLVKMFGEKKWFRSIWKNRLDKLVEHLQEKGYEDTPYEDINWRK